MKRAGPLSICTLLLTGLMLGGCARPSGGAPASPDAGTAPVIPMHGMHHHSVERAPVALPHAQNLTAQRVLSGPTTPPPLRALAANANTNVVALKVLIIGTGPGDADLDAAKAMLDNAGVPYDVLDARPAGSLTNDTLVAADGTGKYQGIVLTTGNLAYEASPGVFQSALDWTAWNVLWQYEAAYKARQLAMYVFPGTWPEDYGLRYVDGTAGASADLKVPASGQSILSDFVPTATIPVRNAYGYPSSVTPVTGVTTTPLLTDASGNVLAAESDTGGRERVALTFAQNPNMLHSQLLSYSLMNWLTQGVYIGEYHRYNELDIDDWFLDGDEIDPTTGQVGMDTFRLSPQDALAARDQQTLLDSRYPVSKDFRYAIAFNGGGAETSAAKSCDPKVKSDDPLTSVSRCLATAFDWISHTEDHPYMDFLNYADSYEQLKGNLTIASQLGLKASTHSLVTGSHSGLGWYNVNGDGPPTDYGIMKSNPNLLKAAQNTQITVIASNHSVASQWDPSCPNCGMVHPMNANVLLVPRWPTNIFYYATTPLEATTGYNNIYGPGGTAPYWDHNLSYTELLDKETDIAMSHVLAGGGYVHYMHQENLRQFVPGRSLAFDWEDALLKKYTTYSTLPLRTLRWDDLGTYMKDRTTFIKAGVTGSWDRAAKTVTLSAPKGGVAFVTGTSGGDSFETYAGRSITKVKLTGATKRTIAVK